MEGECTRPSDLGLVGADADVLTEMSLEVVHAMVSDAGHVYVEL